MQTIDKNLKWRSVLKCLAFAMVAALTVTLSSCDDGEEAPAPTITSVNPTSAIVGASVTVSGTNLADATSVAFNGTTSTIVTKSATSVTTTVPSGATTGKVTVITPAGTATSAIDFTVIATSTVTDFSPASAEVGASVTINGTNLADATAVSFNGTAATIVNKSATSISTTVPEGATTGKISITTPGGVIQTATDFTVEVPVVPTVTSFEPVSAKVGEEVVITGTNLSEATAVSFNGTNGVISAKTATTITTTVPEGATTGKITVTTPDGNAESANDFTVEIIYEASVVDISDFEEADPAAAWGIAQDGDGGITISEIQTEGENSFFHLKGSDINTNHWVGGRYHEIGPADPFGVDVPDMEQVWMTVDVKANQEGTSIGKLVYTVVEEGATDNRRNYEIDFNINWTEWKTISIRLDGFGYWDPSISAMKRAHETNPDITTIWSVALFLKGGSTDVYDISWDNLKFSQGEPTGEEIQGF